MLIGVMFVMPCYNHFSNRGFNGINVRLYTMIATISNKWQLTR